MPGAAVPVIYTSQDTATQEFTNKLYDEIPLLHSKYKPVKYWGYNGHLQTARFSLSEERPGLVPAHYTELMLTLADGTEFSYLLYQPKRTNGTALLLCPGLANSGDAAYMKAFATSHVRHGYYVAVLNPPGTQNRRLVTPRVFNFGCTEYYHEMVLDFCQKFPDLQLIAVGFSLGANIVTKYLGENTTNQQRFIAGMSFCQGYDFYRIKCLAADSKLVKNFYLRRLFDKMKSVIVNHSDVLFNDRRSHHLLTEKLLKSLTRLDQLDEQFTICYTGHTNIDEYYKWASSANYINNIDIPMLIVNAADDPLFTNKLLDVPINYAQSHSKALFVLTKHGGHLGFYKKTTTGSKFDAYTWLDELGLQYADGIRRVLQPSLPRYILPAPTHVLLLKDNREERNVVSNHSQTLHISSSTVLTSERVYEKIIPHSYSTISFTRKKETTL